MNIPIRMIGIATTIFWAFLIAFAATAMYSVKDVGFAFGDAQTGFTADNKILLSIPITIVNKGFYDIGYFTVASQISDQEGNLMANETTVEPVIRKGAEVMVFHNLTLDPNELLRNNQNLLFNDTEMRVHETVGMTIAEAIPVTAEGNFTMPWGAPLYNFAIGTPEYSVHNMTHVRVSVPVSFENHASFALAGDLQLSMFNSNGLAVGHGETAVYAWQFSPYSGVLELYVQMADVTPSGRFELFLASPIINCGPWVIPYG